ncbi:MAG: ester cyclase [Bacteroidetes bacterium]|nr:ester cyclase [Bacteroidota bacterium]
MKTTSFLVALVLFAIQLSFAQNYEQTILNLYAAVDAGEFDKAAAYMTDDVKVSLPFSPQVLDKTVYKQIGSSTVAGFPDSKHQVLEVISGKKSAAFKAIFSGTNTASLQGNPPTGNRVELPFLGYMKFDKKGEITSLDIQFDVAAFNAQLMKGLPDPKAVAEKNVMELYKAMDAGQVDKLNQYCAAGFKISNPFLPAPAPIEAFQGIVQGQKAAFPDMKHEVLEIVSDGKNVVTSGIYSGTNTGSMMGNPPTGNKVSVSFLVLDQLDANGKIVNRQVQFDAKSFEAQLMAGIDPKAKIEANIRAYAAALDEGNAEKVFKYCTADALQYFTGNTKPLNKVETTARVEAFKKGFPDIRREFKDIVIADGKVAARVVVTGTNTGPFMGSPATGNKIEFQAIGIFHLDANGLISKAYLEFDPAVLTNQLKGNAVGSLHSPKH